MYLRSSKDEDSPATTIAKATPKNCKSIRSQQLLPSQQDDREEC